MPDQSRQVPTPAPSDLPTCSILLDGQAIASTYQLMSVSVTKALNRISEAEIIFLDGSAATETFDVSNQPDFLPGRKLEVKAGYHQQEDTIFKGTIVKHAIRILQNDASVLMLTLKHDAFKMTMARTSRLFPSAKDSDAIETILGDYSLTDSVEATQVTHENLLQYYATDWDFVVMRAEQNGLVVINEDEKIAVKKPVINDADLSLYFGSSLLEFEAEMDARRSYTGFSVASWNAADQEMKEETAGSVTITEEGNVSADDNANAISAPEMKVTYPGFLEDAEMTQLADALELKRKLSKIKGRAKCIGIASIQPGSVVELNGVGDRFNGKAYVSGVSHSFTAGKWDTDIQFGLHFGTHADHFDNIAAHPAHGLLPAVNGLQPGVVTQLKDDPKGEDRVLVKLPNLSTSDDAVWARVATLDAGKERGSFFRPEIGDEVVVGFFNDDPRNAVILGMMNSSKLPAPIQATDENPQKGFVTREKMKLLFDDEKKIISIETPGGNKITISDDDKGITILDQNNNKLQLNDSGITMESQKDIQLKTSGGDVKIEGMNVEIKASVNLKAEGSAGASLKSSAITEVKGSMVNIN